MSEHYIEINPRVRIYMESNFRPDKCGDFTQDARENFIRRYACKAHYQAMLAAGSELAFCR